MINLNSLKSWWQLRQKREQVILISAGALILMITLYLYAWLPLSNTVDQMQDRLVQNQLLLKKIQPLLNNPDFLRLAQSSTPTATGDLPAIINQTANQTRLANLMSLSPAKNPNEININFTQVSFDQLINWLENLWDRNQIAVMQFDASSTKNAGMVTAKIILKKS